MLLLTFNFNINIAYIPFNILTLFDIIVHNIIIGNLTVE